jgi:signal transduction histidine kinase
MRVVLDEATVRVLYPAYLLVDGAGLVQRWGPSLGRHLPHLVTGCSWTTLFELAAPPGAQDLEFLATSQQPLRLVCRRSRLAFTGCAVRHEDGVLLCIAHAPANLAAAASRRLTFEDFAPGDTIAAALVQAMMQSQLLRETEDAVVALAAARDAAQAQVDRQLALLANVSHELRTPLTGILGYAEALDLVPELPSTARVHLMRLASAAYELNRCIDALLDYAELEAGAVDFEPTRLTASDLVAAVRQAEPDVQRNGLQIRIDNDLPADFQMLADKRGVSRLVATVTGVLARQTREGTVRFQFAQSRPPGRLHIEVSTSAAVALCEPGRPLLDRSAPRAQGEFAFEAKGVSLDVAYAQRLVELLGGEIGQDPERTGIVRLDLPAPAMP